MFFHSRYLEIQQYLNYKRELRRYPEGKVENFEIIETQDKLMETIQDNEYKRPWTRLDSYQKKVKIKEFIADLEKEEKLNNEQCIILQKELLSLIKQGKINKTSQVNYDKDVEKLISINNVEISNNSYKITVK